MLDLRPTRTLTSVAYLFLVLALTACQPAADTVQEADETPAAPDAGEAHDDSSDDPAHWSYEGDTGPLNWATLDDDWAICSSGTEQSPVDLAGVEDADLPDLVMSYLPTPLAVQHKGHTIQVEYQGGGSLTAGERLFTLRQFHFHTPSEHTVDGGSLPLELHLVHQDAAGHLAVVGVHFEEGEAHPALETLTLSLPAPYAETIVEGATINASDLLPADRTFVTYRGSLTTPPCDESVTWFVMTETQTASADQLARLAAAIPGTNRPVQPLEGRTLERDAS